MLVLKTDQHCAECFTFSTQWSNWKQCLKPCKLCCFRKI